MDLSKFNVQQLNNSFLHSEPFNHVTIDDFFDEDFLNSVLSEIKNYSDEQWYDKKNASSVLVNILK